MKFLHYSDRGSSEFLKLYKECDVLVTTGDLSLSDLAGLEDIPIKKPAFGVYGNHDSGDYLEKLRIVNLHNRVFEYAGKGWGGFQGCLRYKPGNLMFTNNEAKVFADTFPAVDILLLHVGPKGMLDDDSDEFHQGSEYIRSYVIEKQPQIVFLGHQYSNGFMQAGKTMLYRTYGARIIEI